jgi:pyruvate/2-oxoacid:ferredoxin oxidoreductase alpha subunit
MGVIFGGATIPQVSTAGTLYFGVFPFSLLNTFPYTATLSLCHCHCHFSTAEAFTAARSSCFPAILAMSRQSTTGDEEEDLRIKMNGEALQNRTNDEVLPTYKIDVSSPLGIKPETVTGQIEFKDVHFEYPTRKETQVCL